MPLQPSKFTRASTLDRKLTRKIRRIGTDVVVTEDFLTGLQEDSNSQIFQAMKTMFNSGIVNVTTLLKSKTASAITLNAFTAMVGGYTVSIPESSLNVATGDSLVMLECWLAEATNEDVLTKNGFEGASVVTNALLDVRIGVETERAIILKSRLRVVQGINFTTHPFGLSKTADPSNLVIPRGNLGAIPSLATVQGAFVGYESKGLFRFNGNTSDDIIDGMDSGLWISGSDVLVEASAIKNFYNTHDGLIFALPLMKAISNGSLITTTNLFTTATVRGNEAIKGRVDLLGNPPSGTATATVASWVATGETEYPYKSVINVAEVTTNDKPLVDFNRTTYAVAQSAGITQADTEAGKINIRAKKIPTADVTFDYLVIRKGV